MANLKKHIIVCTYHYNLFLQFRHFEIIQSLEDFDNSDDFMAALDSLPKKTKVFTYHQKQAPANWDSKYGAWPARGCRLYSIRLPSANRSNTQP